MQLEDLDGYFRSVLSIEKLGSVDDSLNGVQVEGGGREIGKVAFAVDGCMESFRRAAESGAEVLFVHHGLFWGKSIRLTGSHYRRLEFLIKNRLALYAAHLPLDMHPEFGNNAGIAAALGLEDRQEFGLYHGVKIGFKGRLRSPVSIEGILDLLRIRQEDCNAVLPFGPGEIRTVAIVSGGAPYELEQAIDDGVDLYVTGDSSHWSYHVAMEAGINMISGGHYRTETWGVRLLSERLARDTGLKTVFIDVPTGL